MKKIDFSSSSYDVYSWHGGHDGYICDGDSGGAVQFEVREGINILLGILKGDTSLPSSFCSKESAFLNVTKHIKWIEEIAFNNL